MRKLADDIFAIGAFNALLFLWNYYGPLPTRTELESTFNLEYLWTMAVLLLCIWSYQFICGFIKGLNEK